MDDVRYSSRLRFLDTAHLDDSTVSFQSLDVRGTGDEKLGALDGSSSTPAPAGSAMRSSIPAAGSAHTASCCQSVTRRSSANAT